jgi:deoxyribose-phosphate aldolase
VVDSEGIGGLDEDNNHDMRIFSLALLLSSFFIYNSTGSIDENALNSLSLVVNLTKHIQFKASDGVDDISELVDYLPSFMWVVRDFSL